MLYIGWLNVSKGQVINEKEALKAELLIAKAELSKLEQDSVKACKIDFPYVWFLTCLFHDLGYEIENENILTYGNIDDLVSKSKKLNSFLSMCENFSTPMQLPTTFTLHAFIFWISPCNTASTNLVLIKIKIVSWEAIDDLLDLS
jgi:hypothetical protein